MRNLIIIVIGLIILLMSSIVVAQNKPITKPNDTTKTTEAISKESRESDQIVVYYLHMNRRCMTCEKLEAYSQEAISDRFADALKDSTIIWRVANFEQDGNKHFAKDYGLYSQSLILSRQHDGKEKEWKSLDKIWQLVGDKEKFISYVQMEVQNFMNPAEEE